VFDPESDPRNRAASVARTMTVSSTSTRGLILCATSGGVTSLGRRLDRDRDDVGEQADVRRVLGESDHVEGPRGGQDREPIV